MKTETLKILTKIIEDAKKEGATNVHVYVDETGEHAVFLRVNGRMTGELEGKTHPTKEDIETLLKDKELWEKGEFVIEGIAKGGAARIKTEDSSSHNIVMKLTANKKDAMEVLAGIAEMALAKGAKDIKILVDKHSIYEVYLTVDGETIGEAGAGNCVTAEDIKTIMEDKEVWEEDSFSLPDIAVGAAHIIENGDYTHRIVMYLKTKK